MILTLVDTDNRMTDAWKHAMIKPSIRIPVIHIVNDDFTRPMHSHLSAGRTRAFATAGNSFGIMDGGIDLAVVRAYPSIMGQVQAGIRSKAGGLLPVGSAISVPITRRHLDVHGKLRLIYAPTMVVPRAVQGLNAYYAMRAILGKAEESLGVDELVVCGLCTATGQMPFDAVAAQMSLAIYHHSQQHEHTFIDGADWETANRIYQQIQHVSYHPNNAKVSV